MSTQKILKEFETIYKNTYSKILKYVICKCSNLDDVNDIIQETYIEFYKKLKENKKIQDKQAFIIGIAKNKIMKYINQKGKYRLDVDYRGTNTTGVEIILFISQISSDGEKQKQKNIYPSDVRFVTHSIEEVMLEAGHIKIGIKMHTPPVFGRIARFSLTKS